MVRQYIYSVCHCKEEGEDYEQRKILGIFTSRRKAKEALERYKQLPGFKEDTEEELFIAREKLGLNFWDGGYSTVGEVMASYGTTVLDDYDGVEKRIIDAPYWSKDKQIRAGETGEELAKRLMAGRYQAAYYPSGPESEFYQIKKVQDLKKL